MIVRACEEEKAMKARLAAGIASACAVVFVSIIALGCGGSSPPKMSIAGSVSLNEGGSFSYFRAFIMKGFDFVDDATVTITVNTGTPQNVPSAGFMGLYSTLATTTVNPGDDLTLTVTRGGKTATSTVKMPSRPSVLTPTDSSTVAANTSQTITWGALGTPVPNAVRAQIDSAHTASPNGWDSMVSLPPATEIIIPANTLNKGESSVDLVFMSCIVSTDFGGKAAGVSTFEADNYAPVVTFSTLP